MTHGSLFSGIGGFDLAAEWMGWQNVFHCEWNTFGQRVLKHYWPNAISYNDITKTDFTIHRGRIDILTGGFPCQPYSMAGKRLGKEDDRHLWPEMLRAIREIQPRWVVGENVLGLVNWSGGLVFHEVQADLEAEGYEVQPFVLAAVSVNAPHRRDRVWFVAHATRASERTNELRSLRPEDGEIGGKRAQAIHDAFRSNGFEGNAADTNSNGLDRSVSEHEKQSGQGREYAQRDIGESDDNGDATDTISNGRQKHSGSMECESRTEKEAGHKFTIRSNDNGTDGDAPDTNCNGQYRSNGKHEEQSGQGREYAQRDIGESDDNGDATDTSSRGMEGYGGSSKDKQLQTTEFEQNNSEKFRRMDWGIFPTQSPVCNGNDGISYGLDSITFSKWRQESIKAGGNAVVPQVVLQIFRTIEEYEKMNT